MVQKNFILTDVMKTGDHISYEQFIDSHSLKDQEFICTGEYYTLHNYDLKNYDRKIALIDMRIHNDRVSGNNDYKNDLQNRLRSLNAHGFVFILANPWESMDNIHTEIFMANKKSHKIDVPYTHTYWTGGTSWFWSYMFHKHKSKKFIIDHSIKKYDFLYLNKFPREHRLTLFNRLKSQNLLHKSLHTFLGLQNPIRLPKEYELPWCSPEAYPRWGLDQDLFEKPYNETGYSLISETNDTNDEIFITEKLWKAIITQHIFVVHGNYRYLKKLREIGFKTFDNFFDESYDEQLDKNKRIEHIVAVCEKLRDQDWHQLYEQTKEVRDHNARVFFDRSALSKEVNKTILGFLEFVDSSKISS